MNDITLHNESIKENNIFIFIKIGDNSYAFPALHALEIIKLVELEYPEKLPSFVAGILEYRNQIINIIDLRSILNIETKNYDTNTHILIIQGKDSIYGIIADEIIDIKRIDAEILPPSTYSARGSFTKGVYIEDSKTVIIVDLDALEGCMKTSDKEETNFNEKAARLLPRDISSKEVLHERKIQLLNKTSNISYNNLTNKDVYISFLIGSSIYCLEIVYVGGFYKYSDTKMIKVPCTPEFVKGLISVKGDYLTIIDLKKYFDNEPSKITDKSTIIAIQSKDFHVGFIVDEISDTLNIQPSELYKNKGKASKAENKSEILEYVKDNKLYLILNVAEILNNEKLYVG